MLGLIDRVLSMFFKPTTLSRNTQTCIGNVLMKKTQAECKPIVLSLDLGISDRRAIFICIVKHSLSGPH